MALNRPQHRLRRRLIVLEHQRLVPAARAAFESLESMLSRPRRDARRPAAQWRSPRVGGRLAEHELVGALMFDPSVIPRVQESGLSAGDFESPRLGALASLLFELADEGSTYGDLVGVVREADRRGQLGRMGGAPFVAEVLDAAATSATAELRARQVRSFAIEREIDRLHRGAAQGIATPARHGAWRPSSRSAQHSTGRARRASSARLHGRATARGGRAAGARLAAPGPARSAAVP